MVDRVVKRVARLILLPPEPRIEQIVQGALTRSSHVLAPALRREQPARHRRDTIQTGFVDEPRRAVEDADSLVAHTMKRVTEVFGVARRRTSGLTDLRTGFMVSSMPQIGRTS